MRLPAHAAFASLAIALAVPGAHAAIDNARADALMKSAGCNACHLVDKKLIGPGYKDVAARYKGDPAAAKKLEAAVRAGTKGGVWGPVPMVATPPARLGDADLRALIEWILRR